ncbi:MAG: class I SAM-dependent methyltransferase [Ideonella sp.]|jgi:SAM-dependent methyltransferase|nr:class I SAM-dependent methyltransferase [Ideonella sp.]
MSSLWHRLRRAGRRAREIHAARRAGGPPCGTCGFAGQLLHRDSLWPELIAAWELDERWAGWMNRREGSRCAWCGSSLRAGQLAAGIVEAANARAGTHARHLAELFRDPRARALSIAEINSAGNLHRYLRRCPGLRHSEYGSRDPAVPSEDLGQLSYPDGSFDLAVTSDVLEHVPDLDQALRETRRILRPGGCHVFSVPMVEDRPTRQRARLEGGTIRHLLPPSHHGAPTTGSDDFLVFWELGGDFPDRVRAAGFDLELRRDPHNPAVQTFLAWKRV